MGRQPPRAVVASGVVAICDAANVGSPTGGGQRICYGWWWGHHTIVTADHALRDVTHVVCLGMPNARTRMRGTIRRRVSEVDLAALDVDQRVGGGAGGYGQTIPAGRPVSAETVRIGGLDVVAVVEETIARSGSVLAGGTCFEGSLVFSTLNVGVHPGDSGAPVFSVDDGALIGMIVGRTSTGRAVAIGGPSFASRLADLRCDERPGDGCSGWGA